MMLSTLQFYGERVALIAGAEADEDFLHCDVLIVHAGVTHKVIVFQDMRTNQKVSVKMPDDVLNSYVPQIKYNVSLERT